MKSITLGKNIVCCFAILASLLFAFNANAQDGKVRLTNKAMKLEVTQNENGEKEYNYVEPGLAIPGDVILYSIMFENIGDEPATNLVINDPIPNNSKYRMGSARGENTAITFSIDGGKNFGNPEDLIVKDSAGKTWVAKPEDYTHIRWVYTRPLAPGEKGEVAFETVIRGNE